MTAFPEADAGILCAAVADYRPEIQADEKIKRESKEGNDASPGSEQRYCCLFRAIKREGQVLVGFALETNNEATNAESKLKRKISISSC